MRYRVFTVALAMVVSSGSFGQFLASPAQPASSIGSADLGQLDGLLHAVPPELLFRPDDVISVNLYGVKDFVVVKQHVAEDGGIVFPLVGRVQVAGLTIAQLQQNLQAALRDANMVINPQISITVEDRPTSVVTVSGAVTKPGTFPAFRGLTLMDYLSQAGGLDLPPSTNTSITPPASATVTLMRPSLAGPVQVPLGTDAAKTLYGRIPVFPGDEILVSREGFIYAFGAFKNQGVFPLKASSATTVTQLAALAGGVGYEADRADAHIVRLVGGVRTVVPVDVAKILKGRAPDVTLQADDILFVPTNQSKAALKGGAASIVVALATAYLYSR